MFGYNSDELDRRVTNKYAVVILLPEGLDEVIAPLRRQYDPDHSVIAAHVTVVFPFQCTRSLDDISRVIKPVTDRIGPFPLELSSIGDFYPGFPLIYWQVNRHPNLDELYKSLYTGLDLALPHKQFVPHVTVAREISPHRVVMVKERIVPYLPEESFRVTTLNLVSPVADRQWVSVRSFPLGVAV
ncbi:MAG: 2'-5' RNA ligase family protein [Candidatus Zixiibacteriota bacterium]